VRSGRLRALPVQRMKIRRHFHVIHDERRPLSASARAFISFLEANGERPAGQSSTKSRPEPPRQRR
jgi:hypothetical protein